MNESILGALSAIACGVCFCLIVWDAMKDREVQREAEKRMATRALQWELDEATRLLQEADYLRRESMAQSREMDRLRWRIHYREAESYRYIRRFRLMWDGQVGAA